MSARLRLVQPGEAPPAEPPSLALTFIVCVLAWAWASSAGLLDPGTLTLAAAAAIRVAQTARWAWAAS